MTETEALYRTYVDAINAHDVDGVLACFAEDCVFEDVAVEAVCHGTGELRRMLEYMYGGIPDFRIEVRTVVASDSHYAAEVEVGGTMTGAGNQRWTARAMAIGDVVDGKIARHSDYWNAAGFLVQTGVLVPAKR